MQIPISSYFDRSWYSNGVNEGHGSQERQVAIQLKVLSVTEHMDHVVVLLIVQSHIERVLGRVVKIAQSVNLAADRCSIQLRLSSQIVLF